jgi:hypothetical protein
MGTKTGLFRTRQGYKNCIIISALVVLTGCSGLTRHDADFSFFYCIGLCVKVEGDGQIDREIEGLD